MESSILSMIILLMMNNLSHAFENEYCIDFGRELGNPHWLSGNTGEWKYGGDKNGKPSYQQISCTDPKYVNDCNPGGLLYSESDKWTFGSGVSCLDGIDHVSPDLCKDYWGLSDALKKQGYPLFSPGSCAKTIQTPKPTPSTTTPKPTTAPPTPKPTSTTTPKPTTAPPTPKPTATTTPKPTTASPTTRQPTSSTTSTPEPTSNRFIINNDPNQHVQLNKNTGWIENARNFLRCDFKNDVKYIIMKTDDYNKIKEKHILLMNDDVFQHVDLSAECKFPVLKILDQPAPETLPDNEMKIYVSTAVAMTDYIDDVNVDLDNLEMTFLDPNHVSVPVDDIAEHAKSYSPMQGMEFEDAKITTTEYTINCVENCQEYDPDEFQYWLQLDYENKLKANAASDYQTIVPKMVAEKFGGDGSVNVRRRLGFWSWIKNNIVRPVVHVVKKVVQVVKQVAKTIIQVIDGDVDISEEYGIDVNQKKSKTFSSKYKYNKKNLKATVEGNLDIEYGVKFQLKLFSKLKAKWTIIPPNFEQFRFTVGGHTEFLAWIRAHMSAAAEVEMLLFEKKKNFKFMLGPVPVIVTLKADLKLKLDTAVNAKFMQQIGYEPLSVEFGIEYVNGDWKTINDVNLEFTLINNRQFKWGESTDAKDITCPLEMGIDAYLIPRFTLTLYKVVYAGIEEEFHLENSYHIGDSCISGKNVCDIIKDGNNKLGLNSGLDLIGTTNIILGAKIEIFGIQIVKKEWAFPINALSFEKHLGETCNELATPLDYIFSNFICHCDDIPSSNGVNDRLCIYGATTSNHIYPGEYVYAGIRDGKPYYKHPYCHVESHNAEIYSDGAVTFVGYVNGVEKHWLAKCEVDISKPEKCSKWSFATPQISDKGGVSYPFSMKTGACSKTVPEVPCDKLFVRYCNGYDVMCGWYIKIGKNTYKQQTFHYWDENNGDIEGYIFFNEGLSNWYYTTQKDEALNPYSCVWSDYWSKEWTSNGLMYRTPWNKEWTTNRLNEGNSSMFFLSNRVLGNTYRPEIVCW